MFHDWCNVLSLLLIGKSSPCGGSGFPLSLSEWSFTICLTPYNRTQNVLSASLNKTFPSLFSTLSIKHWFSFLLHCYYCHQHHHYVCCCCYYYYYCCCCYNYNCCCWFCCTTSTVVATTATSIITTTIVLLLLYFVHVLLSGSRAEISPVDSFSN